MSIPLYLLTILLSGIIGVGIFIGAIYIFNQRQKYDVWKVLEQNPVALAIVVSSFIIGLALVVSRTSF